MMNGIVSLSGTGMSVLGFGKRGRRRKNLEERWLHALYGRGEGLYLPYENFEDHLKIMGEDGIDLVSDLVEHQRRAGMRGDTDDMMCDPIASTIGKLPTSVLRPDWTGGLNATQRDAVTIDYLMTVALSDGMFILLCDDDAFQNRLFDGLGVFREHGARWTHDAFAAYFDRSAVNGLNAVISNLLSDRNYDVDMAVLMRGAVGGAAAMSASADSIGDAATFGFALSESMKSMIANGCGGRECTVFGDFRLFGEWRRAAESPSRRVPACVSTVDAVEATVGPCGPALPAVVSALAWSDEPRDWSAVSDWLAEGASDATGDHNMCDFVVSCVNDGARFDGALAALDFADVILMAEGVDPAPDAVAGDDSRPWIGVIASSSAGIVATSESHIPEFAPIPRRAAEDALGLLGMGYPKDMAAENLRTHMAA